MKKLLGASLAAIICTWAYAQQDVQFTQFANNKLFFNPGVAGSSGAICITAAHRTQWAGFNGAPSTQNVNAEIPIGILHGAVLVNITADKIGFFQDITAGVGYAFQYDLGIGTLGAGFEVDFRNKQLTSGAWITPDAGFDPFVATFNTTDLRPDLNFGVFFNSPTIWGGISSSRLLAADLLLESNTTPPSIGKIKSARHYYLMGGYNWEIPSTDIVLKPALMVKSDFLAKPQIDVNVAALYNNLIWGGVSYRLEDAISIMAGYYIKPYFRITYSYDLTTSALRTVSSGSHEIMAHYCFSIEVKPKEPSWYRNPIFL